MSNTKALLGTFACERIFCVCVSVCKKCKEAHVAVAQVSTYIKVNDSLGALQGHNHWPQGQWLWCHGLVISGSKVQCI